MTNERKGWGAGITLATVATALALWPHAMPWLEWLAPIFGREQVQAVLAASAIGVFVNFGLPHALPSSWPEGRTRAVAGWLGFALTFAAALLLVPTRTGFVYAMLAGSATPTAAACVRAVVYALKPCAKPASLKP